MKYRKFFLVWLLCGLFLFGGCASSPQNDHEAHVLIQQVKARFVPDSRTERFEVQAQTRGDSVVLVGETTLPQAKAALLDSMTEQDIPVADSIEVLPAANLQNKTYALVNNSVANIRSKPHHPAQLTTQALLGMPLRVLDKRGGWYLVQTPEDYISWVDAGGITRMGKAGFHRWADAEKLIYTQTYGFSHQKPDKNSGRVSDLVLGSILKLEGSAGNYYKVAYPDGRTAYVAKDEATPFDKWKKEVQITQKSLVKVAKTMMGTPYLWGGTSSKGTDCSGFTKTIYFMNGRVIPRDANQQAEAGMPVDSLKHWSNLQKGDLLFFGHPATDSTDRRIVHVGMWIGNDQFIHSSGKVRISSVDSTADNYDPYNVGRYLEARRYLNNWQGNIIQTKDMYKNMEQ